MAIRIGNSEPMCWLPLVWHSKQKGRGGEVVWSNQDQAAGSKARGVLEADKEVDSRARDVSEVKKDNAGVYTPTLVSFSL